MSWVTLILKILSTGVLVVLLFGFFWALIVRTQKYLTVGNKRDHLIKLANQGNFTSIFILSVQSAEQRICFKFLMNDIPLAEAAAPEIFQPVPPSGSSPAQARAGSNSVMSTAMKGGKSVAASAGWMASFMGTLSALLPGRLGSSLRTQSEVLRETQSTVISTTQSPINAQRRVNSLQQQTGKMSGTGHGTNRFDPVHGPSHSRDLRTGSVENPVQGGHVVQTKPLEPGENISLVLRIEPVKRHHPEGTFSYTLTSRQFPVDPMEVDPPGITRHGLLHFPHVEVWRYWLAPAATFLFVSVCLCILLLIFRFIWFM